MYVFLVRNDMTTWLARLARLRLCGWLLAGHAGMGEPGDDGDDRRTSSLYYVVELRRTEEPCRWH